MLRGEALTGYTFNRPLTLFKPRIANENPPCVTVVIIIIELKLKYSNLSAILKPFLSCQWCLATFLLTFVENN